MITINLGAFMVLSKALVLLIFLSNSYFGSSHSQCSSSGGEPPKWTSGLASGSGLFGSAMACTWPTLWSGLRPFLLGNCIVHSTHGQ